MLRYVIRSFLVAALLVSVASEPSRNCSICGDGYEVGSPYVSTSLGCPDAGQGSTATSCTCKDLEIAGLQGLMSDCSNVSLVIFEACNCQKNTSQKTLHPTYSPSGTPVSFRPTTNAPTPTPGGSEDLPNYVYFYVLVLGFVPFLLICISGCFDDNIATVCWRVYTFRTENSYIEEAQQNGRTIPVSTTIFPIGNYRLRRPLVLAALFPKEVKVEGDGNIAGRRNLKYDPQSKQYEFCEDAPDAAECTICMDCLVPMDDAVTGLCSHSYHRQSKPSNRVQKEEVIAKLIFQSQEIKSTFLGDENFSLALPVMVFLALKDHERHVLRRYSYMREFVVVSGEEEHVVDPSQPHYLPIWKTTKHMIQCTTLQATDRWTEVGF
ncbi:hypothetical protein MHU86_24086 [Fragilaria crotonensis]|nr:hypothetical protein MHU86_24086 [Fragilaria crotonensis]